MGLGGQRYGKRGIRLVKVIRHPSGDHLSDVTIDVALDGDFEAAFTEADNRKIVATDTMRNTVYVLATNEPVEPIELFGLTTTDHFLRRYPQVTEAHVWIRQHPWTAVEAGGEFHHHAFARTANETPTCSVTRTHENVVVESGIDDLIIIKTAGSAFEQFVTDEFTTLADTRDRLLATKLSAQWRYRDADVDFGESRAEIREVLLALFAAHESESVQHTLYDMGRAVLDARADVDRVHLVMPNIHHIPFDVTPFDAENRNEVFVATDRPYGHIEATVTR